MSIFGRIKDAILGRPHFEAPPATPETPAAAGEAVGSAMPQFGGVNAGMTDVQSGQGVDVEQALTRIAESKGNPNLNYRSSIVDLMKLLDLDSSLDNRKELATELGYTGEKDGSAEMNIWLHRKVMEQLEANGGRVPESMKN